MVEGLRVENWAEEYSGPFCLDNFLINLRYNFLLVKVIVY